MGLETIGYMETKDLCGAIWLLRELKGTGENP